MIHYESERAKRLEMEIKANRLLHVVHSLWQEKQIELVLCRHQMIDGSVSKTLALFDKARIEYGITVSIDHVITIAEFLYSGDFGASKIDVGALAAEIADAEDFDKALSTRLQEFTVSTNPNIAPKDVVLFGFGRIGRLLARELIHQTGKGLQLRLRAIVVRKDTDDEIRRRASLLRTDSVHGKFLGFIEEDYENKGLRINGQFVQFVKAPTPDAADYTAYGITDALLIDNTGIYTNREALSVHLKAKGVSKVLLTAPGSEIPNIVFGANHKEHKPEQENIFSAASCTTNAITPILKVIHEKIGLESGHIETVHAYTNDQNLVDNMHKKDRRGRAAGLNMVITSTGAGKAVVKVIPELKGKLTANAVRVPTPDGSLAILNLRLASSVTLSEINAIIKNASQHGELVDQIEFNTDKELVSSDIIGKKYASVYDSNATVMGTDGKSVNLYVWYDNEYGYCRQVMRLAKYISNVRRKTNY